MYIYVWICMHVCIYMYMYNMYGCIYVYGYACMHVCMAVNDSTTNLYIPDKIDMPQQASEQVRKVACLEVKVVADHVVLVLEPCPTPLSLSFFFACNLARKKIPQKHHTCVTMQPLCTPDFENVAFVQR